MRRYGTYFSLVLLAVVLVFSRCANPVTPEGGPKDITPPTVKQCDPPNNSIHFKGKTIRIDFDEFINAETSGDKVLVSPPLTEPPDYRARGKTLVISFADTLRPETTYSLDFGKAISDITEGNKLAGFKYAFSTGSTLDSMSLSGNVTDAFTTAPVKDALVMLYDPHNDTVPADSLPMKVRPLYLTRTVEDGSYNFTNLAPGRYMIFALSDKTGDLLFNVAGEQIAFLDSLISPWYVKPAVKDTAARADTLKTRTDTIKTVAGGFTPIKLRMYEPLDSLQSLDKSGLVRDRMATLIFKYPAKNLHLTPLNADSLSHWALVDPSPEGDTITLWLTGNLPDSLRLKVSADKMKTDTIELPVVLKEMSRKGKKDEQEKAKPLEINPNTRGGTLNFFKYPLLLVASYPLAGYDFSRFRLIDGKDTLQVSASVIDSVHRVIRVDHKWTEGKQYQVFIPDSALTAINGMANDTVRIRFKTAEASFFGNLKITVTLPDSMPQVIIQLLTEKEKLVEERVINKTGRIEFNYLLPAKYKLKAILDPNRNRQWDSGDYLRKVQPETVLYFPRTFDLRANWDVEENWQL